MNANKRFWQTAVILLPMICALSILPEIHAQNPASKSDVAQQKIKNGWRIVKGQVKSEQGEPLIGVTVYMEKGKVSGVTNIDGMYEITIPNTLVTLCFSYVGMEMAQLTIESGKTDVTRNLIMHSNTTIKEVVVTGIFQKNKNAFTGSVSTITNKELKEFGNKNLLTSIANIDPSFNMLMNNQFGSDPNHLPDVQIRGTANLPTITNLQDNTRTDLNTPLIIMDGFEINITRMMDLNEDEVESITLLKDGSATAIYGSRGANGVIVIKRKSPKAGRLRFTYSGSLNIEAPDLTDYHLLGSADKLELERRSGYYDSTDPMRDFRLKRRYSELLSEVVRGVDTDWLSKPLRAGVGQRHNIRLEGGDESFRYATSLQYNQVTGVMKGSQRSSFNGSITLSYHHFGLLFTNDLNIGYTHSDESPYGSFSDYTRLNPYWKPYDDTGNLIKMFDTNVDFYGSLSNLPSNPLYNALLNQKDSQQYTDITDNFSIEWRPFEGFVTRGRVGFTWTNRESDYFRPAKHTMFEADEYQTDEGSLRKGCYRYGVGKVTNYEVALTASYSKLLAEKHLVYAAVNWNVMSNFLRNYLFVVEGFTDEKLDFPSNALQYQKGGKPSGGEARTRAVGLVMNANYSFDNRYYTDLAYRIDGSSQFGKNRRFAPFYSIGIGWNMHNEKFMKDVYFINRLKLRASYGQTGSQKFNAYQAVATYNYYLNDRYNRWTGAYQKALENPDLEWQKTNKWNGGMELSLFDNRLSFVADVYFDYTSNLLSSLNLPLSNGFTSYIENIGKVENKGFEIKATAFLLRNEQKRLSWSVTGSLVHNEDKVVKLSQAMKDEYAKRLLVGGIEPNSVIREGESQYTIYAVPSLGIDPSTGFELYRKRNGEVTYVWDAADRIACGVNQPKYRGMLSTMMRWKDFTANISFGYRFGGQLYNSTLVSRIENADKLYNVDERVFKDRWQKPDDRTFFKGLTNQSPTYSTSRFVQDERTLSCQNIHLSYMLSNNPWLRRILGIQVLTLSSDLSDLFYFSSVKQERGLSYPYSRRFSFTLSVNF
ncbi:TonB-dependent receptor [Hoylesella timonensis 4401737 = DSM 22865 = JCM 15640]|uniref:SusC/RagA family TonB-linked outer membrane protein n=1 Tax=Hoylesella timonensis TaxID=386414 RepID=UPI0003FFE144|nr:SusC/RagA family TonB-linked outer membrane protein [Hoylesella timonensis]